MSIAFLVVGAGFGVTVDRSPAQTTGRATGANTITVTGEGQAVGTADSATVSVGVSTDGVTARAAASENAEIMAEVLGRLRAHGVRAEELRTTGLSVIPQHTSARDLLGYSANNTVSVSVQGVERAGELLDVALAGGANRVGSVQLGIRDSASIRNEALQRAMDSARTKAEVLARSAGLQIVSVGDIAEDPPPQQPVTFMGSSPGVITPVEGGSLRIVLRVRVSFMAQ